MLDRLGRVQYASQQLHARSQGSLQRYAFPTLSFVADFSSLSADDRAQLVKAYADATAYPEVDAMAASQANQLAATLASGMGSSIGATQAKAQAQQAVSDALPAFKQLAATDGASGCQSICVLTCRLSVALHSGRAGSAAGCGSGDAHREIGRAHV